jgi:uncharacterized phage protein gp47/JayE
MTDTSIFDPNTNSTVGETSIIPYPVIDPRNEEQLADEALLDAFTLSEGRLNDTTDHNPLAVFARTLSRLGSEILWYANKLPRALAVAYLRLAGVERSLGQKARVNLTFTLTGAVTSTYTIPAGFEVRPDSTLFVVSGVDLVFTTLSPLVITPGNSSGSVLAECNQTGQFGNVPAGVLTQFSIPYANLAEVRNLEPAYGGSDAETLNQVESRALNAIRRRDTLIVQGDYEQAASDLLGGNGRAIAVPLVGADGQQYQLGSVHVFGVKGDGTLPTESECNDVQGRLAALVPLGTSVYFSPVELIQLDVRVIAQFYDGYDTNVVFENMLQALKNFLNPATYAETDYVSISDLEFVLRNVLGVRRVNSVLLNGIGLDTLLNSVKSLPILHSAYFEGYSSSEIIYNFGFGEGDAD